ncbi:MAG: DUF1302 domain-containing protein [Pseudomonas sp.]|uniref:DUF1302 domain-containing protein n=1 Tax=Pseudomonas sp. TaxID=306 RepID=UPI0033931105
MKVPRGYHGCKGRYLALGWLPLLVAGTAPAMEFSVFDNQLSGSLDTTLSYGSMWRVQGRDADNITDINADDGNRNFDTGLVSEVYKVTSDLSARYENYGLFLRGTAHYDTQIMDKRTDYLDTVDGIERPSQSFPDDQRFTEETRHTAGRTGQILDAYVSGNWDLGELPLSARVGRQVFSWGEGVFYRGGINSTNPVDASKFHLPGAELKEVLVPMEALSFNLGLSDNLSMEAFYQWRWKESRLDPVGTYFSDTDLFADGGQTVYSTDSNPLLAELLNNYALASSLQIGGIGQGPFGPNSYTNGSTGTFKVANVGEDIEADDSGQFGVTLRYVAESLNATEFAVYLINYHAKEPQLAVDLSGYQGVDGSDPIWAVLPAEALPGLATLDLAGNAQARRDYVEDIRLYGFSFNTTLGDMSVSGEVAYRPNTPISIAATDDILGDVLLPGLAGVSQVWDRATPGAQACTPVAGKSLCRGSLFENYERAETFNLSLSGVYNFGPLLSFDSLFGVAELASQHIRGSDLSYLAWDGSERQFTSAADKAYVDPAHGDKEQIDRDSYGYTLLLSGSWNDVYRGVKLTPYAVFQHDFQGNSDRTGNFIEGRKAHTLGIDASYLNSFEVGLQYTDYYGAGLNNGLRDRDNMSLSAKYSF